MNELEISCLPADLPEFVEVDLSGIKKNVSVHASDIKLPKGVKFVSHGKGDPVVVSVTAPRVEEEAAPAAEGAAPAADAKAAPAKK
jgi:large subunit ribosomal protein L25